MIAGPGQRLCVTIQYRDLAREEMFQSVHFIERPGVAVSHDRAPSATDYCIELAEPDGKYSSQIYIPASVVHQIRVRRYDV